MLTVQEALQLGRAALAGAGIIDAALEAEVLLMYATGADRAHIYTHPDRLLSDEASVRFRRTLDRRLAREPAAYVIGEREFFGLPFQVDRRVLIPRPETEVLVETALDLLHHRQRERPLVADVGTGSGAIAVSLALVCPAALVYGLDVSADALAVAAANVARHAVGDRVRLLGGDLLAPLPEPVDLVVANLPYVPAGDLSTLEPEVRSFEPSLALVGGVAGLDLIDRLLVQVPRHLRPGGAVALEIGAGQAAAVVALAAQHLPAAAVRTVRDLAGHERVVVVEDVVL